MTFDEEDEENRPGSAGEDEDHFNGGGGSASGAMNEDRGWSDGQGKDDQRAGEGLNVNERVAVNSDEVFEVVTIFADGVVECATINAGPGGKRDEWNPEYSEPERKFHAAVGATLDGVDFHADAVIGEGFHIRRGRCFALARLLQSRD